MGGFVIGWVTGVVTISGPGRHVGARGDPRAGAPAGAPICASTSKIDYLNLLVRRRLHATPQVIVGEIKTTDLELGLLPSAGMVLTPTFDVAGLFNVSPSATNQFSVLNGKLTMGMIGQPRLGDLQAPLDLLPFDLAGQVRQAVDQLTNSVLLTELNDTVALELGSDAFDVTRSLTENDYLQIKLFVAKSAGSGRPPGKPTDALRPHGDRPADRGHLAQARAATPPAPTPRDAAGIYLVPSMRTGATGVTGVRSKPLMGVPTRRCTISRRRARRARLHRGRDRLILRLAR